MNNYRNAYNALTSTPEWVKRLLEEAEENGAWETGIESDKKQRGSAINTALYGYDTEQQLAVVQVREAVFHPRRFTRVRKDYYLIGHTETGNFFAHPVDSPVRSSYAMSGPKMCVDYVLSKIWNCRIKDLEDIERQGDIAFVAVPSIPKSAVPLEDGEVILRDSHKLTGRIWKDWDGTYYTRRGARLVHSKRQHATIKAKAGVYRVQEGVRAQTWGHTTPLGD
jgi:hypothetical protein